MKAIEVSPEESMRMLRAKGCGAWKGSKRCGVELDDDSITLGGIDMMFQSCLCAYPFDVGTGDPVSVAFFCKEHRAEPWKDMAPEIRERQLKEQAKFRDLVGVAEIPS